MLYTSNTDSRVGCSERRCEGDCDRNFGGRSRRHDVQDTPSHSEYRLAIPRMLCTLTCLLSFAMPTTTSPSTSLIEIPNLIPTISRIHYSSEKFPISPLRRASKSQQMMTTRPTSLAKCRCGPSIISEAIALFSFLVPRPALSSNPRNRRRK